MISLDQLKQRFPVQNVPPYGECIVIPGPDFDPDWETYLDEEGYACIFTDIEDEKVTLVPTIKRHRGKSEKTVHEPRTEPRVSSKEPARKFPSGMKGPEWSQEDENRLIKRVADVGGNVTEVLTKEFPGRSHHALKQKLKKLVAKGKAPPGKVGRPRKAVSPGLQKDMDKALENVCRDCGLPKDLCCCDEEKKASLRQEPRARIQKEPIGSGPEHIQKDPVEKLLQEILDLLQPEDESVTFAWYCRKCRQGGEVLKSEEVWRVCPICLEPLIVWDVQETE